MIFYMALFVADVIIIHNFIVMAKRFLKILEEYNLNALRFQVCMYSLAVVIGVTSFRYNIFDNFTVLISIMIGVRDEEIISLLLYGLENRILIYIGNLAPNLIILFVILVIDFFASDNKSKN